MSAYLVVEFTVKDPDVYRDQYSANAGKTAKKYGAEPVANGDWEVLDGEPSCPRGRSCDSPTAKRPSTGTTRLNTRS